MRKMRSIVKLRKLREPVSIELTEIPGSRVPAPGVALQILLLGAFCCILAQSHAQEFNNGTYLGASLETGYDSNLTRAPVGSGARATPIDGSYLLAGFDQTYERERLRASAQLGRVIFGKAEVFDYSPQDLRVLLDSSLPSSVDTEIQITRTEQLASLADLNSVRRDIIVQDLVGASVGFPVIGHDWRVLVAGDGSHVRNSSAIDHLTDVNILDASAGLRYQPGSENYVDFLARGLNASYPHAAGSVFSGNSYHDRGADLRTRWRFSGSSVLEGRVGYVERRNETLTYFNFSGPAYDLTYRWTPDPKVAVTAFVLRATGAPGDSAYFAAVTHTYRLVPAYLPTERIRLEMRIEWSTLNYYGNALTSGSTLPTAARVDGVSGEGLSAVWTLRRWLQLRFGVDHDQRSTNVPIFDYHDHRAMLTAEGRF